MTIELRAKYGYVFKSDPNDYKGYVSLQWPGDALSYAPERSSLSRSTATEPMPTVSCWSVTSTE